MKRRSMLAAIGTVAVAGCTSQASPGTSPEDDSNETDGEPDVRDAKTENTETWLRFGEWSEHSNFGVMVEGVEVVDQITLERTGATAVHTFEGERMAIVDYQLKAIAADRDEYRPHLTLEAFVDGDRLDLGVADTEFAETKICDGPACYPGRLLDATLRSERDLGHGMIAFEPGEKRKCWNGVLVPTGTVASDVAVTMDSVGWVSR